MMRIYSILTGSIIIFLAGIAQPQESFSYRLQYGSPGADRVTVEIEVPGITAGPQTLIIPRAIPMGYTQEPYDRFVSGVEVFASSGEQLQVTREDGPRWHIGDESATISKIRYAVDIAAMEREILDSSDASKRRVDYLSLLGYSVFAYLEGFEDHSLKLSIEVPEDWPVTSTLAPVVPVRVGNTEADAADFYSLADSQIVAGPASSVFRLRGSKPLFLALYTEGEVDVAMVKRSAEESMAAVINYFGSAPFPHFTVVQELLQPISTRHNYNYSMEHLTSATFYLSADRGITAATDPEELERTRYNYAHHFAHAWIPKRVSGAGYRPFNWELAPVIDSIWFSEGFAQYLAIAAVADGLPEAEGSQYLEHMIQSRFRDNLDVAPLFSRRMTLVELSRSASTLSSYDFRTLRNVASRGGLMAAEMDAWIRQESAGTKSLRDGLRYLVRWSERAGRPLAMEDLPEIFEHAVGLDTKAIMQRWMKPLAR